MGKPQFHNASRVVNCAMFTKVCVAHISYIGKFFYFSIIRSLCEVICSQDVAKEGS